jgi:hypothetical protein
MKKLVAALLVLLALAIGSFAFWNGFVYPPFRLHGLSVDQYQAAWETAARGFCTSSDLTFERPDFVKFRKPDTGDEAYVWGVARCLTQDGRERLAWIYLEWSYKRKVWTRSYTLVLADDDDEVYYTPSWPGQYDRARIALGKLMAENARHVREYLDSRGRPEH